MIGMENIAQNSSERIRFFIKKPPLIFFDTFLINCTSLDSPSIHFQFHFVHIQNVELHGAQELRALR